MKRIITALLSLSFFSCTPSHEEEPVIPPPTELRSDAFALDVFRTLVQENAGNVTFSPAGLESLLRVLQHGARGETAAELAALPMGDAGVPSCMQVTQAAALFADEQFKLKSAPEGTAVIPVPLAGATDEAAERINDWVQEKTRGMIPGVITPADLQQVPLRCLVAVNALALEEKWLRPFDPEKTVLNAPFFCENSRQATVPMMYREAAFRHAEGEDWQAVALFYRTDGHPGNPGCFLAVMPQGNARDFVSGLTPEKFSSIRRALATAEPREICIGLPRFELLTPVLKLTGALKSCGLRHLFSEAADLSGFADEPLAVESVLQRCYIKTDEQGTSAAAATTAIIKQRSLAPELTFNRPFIWAITDLSTSAAPYFLGLFEHP